MRVSSVHHSVQLAVGVAFGAAALSNAEPIFSQVAQQIIAVTGEATPSGNGEFSAFSVEGPALNESGEVAYWAALSETDANRGIYRSNGVTTTEIVRSGQTDTSGTTFSEFIGPVMLNDAGQVGFLSRGNHGVYRGDGTTPILLNTTGGGFNRFGFNSSGHASTYDGNTVRRGDGQTITTIASAGQAAPGASGSFYNVYGSSMNDAGEVAFFAILAGTAGAQDENEGLYRGDGLNVVEVTREGRATPNAVGVYATMGDSQINNSGRTAFVATVRGSGTDSTSNWGLFAVDADGSDHELARTGRAAPGGGTLVFSSQFFTTFSHNNAGLVAFPAAIATAGGERQSILISDDGTLTEVVRMGELTPDPARRFSSLPTGAFAFNDEGDVAFLARIIRSDASQQVPPDSRDALYFYDDAQGLVEIVRTGDPLLGSTISLLGLSPTTGLVGDERGGINNVNQLAYYARLSDGRNAIVLATIPEPSTAVICAAATGMLFIRRRR